MATQVTTKRQAGFRPAAFVWGYWRVPGVGVTAAAGRVGVGVTVLAAPGVPDAGAGPAETTGVGESGAVVDGLPCGGVPVGVPLLGEGVLTRVIQGDPDTAVCRDGTS